MASISARPNGCSEIFGGVSNSIQTSGNGRRSLTGGDSPELRGGCLMERFVNQQNIERYRKLLDISTDEPQRRLIFKLLSEEQEKFRTSTNETIAR
jgi:hypothetical protein